MQIQKLVATIGVAVNVCLIVVAILFKYAFGGDRLFSELVFNVSWFSILILLFIVSMKTKLIGTHIQFWSIYITGLTTAFCDHRQAVAVFFFAIGFLISGVHGMLSKHFAKKITAYFSVIVVTYVVGMVVNGVDKSEWEYLCGYFIIAIGLILMIFGILRYLIDRSTKCEKTSVKMVSTMHDLAKNLSDSVRNRGEYKRSLGLIKTFIGDAVTEAEELKQVIEG